MKQVVDCLYVPCITLYLSMESAKEMNSVKIFVCVCFTVHVEGMPEFKDTCSFFFNWHSVSFYFHTPQVHRECSELQYYPLSILINWSAACIELNAMINQSKTSENGQLRQTKCCVNQNIRGRPQTFALSLQTAQAAKI